MSGLAVNLSGMFVIGLILVASNIVAGPVTTTSVTNFVKEASVRLDERLSGDADKRKCEGYLSRARGTEKQTLIVLMAQYKRIMEKDPEAGLKMLAPLVLSKDRFEEWEKDAQSAKDEKRAPVSKPIRSFEPFPSVQEWEINTTNMPVVFEFSRMYMALGKHPEALRIADYVGTKHEGIYRIRAAENAGDAMFEASSFTKSVEFYEFALQGFRTIMSANGSLIDPEHKNDKDRIEKSLAKALAMLEIERYGLGYVRYRDARLRHKKDAAIPEALLMYEDLYALFPKTVYAEAGKAYACECLLSCLRQRLRDLCAVTRISH